MVRYLHLDFETYSDVDLKKVGLDRYSKHPSTTIELTAWAWDQEPVQQCEGAPVKVLREAAADPNVIFVAFNAQFERVMMREVMGIEVPPERWRCTMIHAYSLGFSGGLKDVGAQLGIAQDKQKLTDGQRLVLKFCKPAPKNHLADRYDKDNAPEDWERYKEYNVQDVVAEREIEMLLSGYPMPDFEWQLYALDQRINDRGLPVDLELVENTLKVYHNEKRHLMAELRKATGLDNPNSVQQLAGWFQAHGKPMTSFAADKIKKVLDYPPWEGWPLGKPRDVLKLRQQSARTAGAKWDTFKRITDPEDHRIRYQFQFNGAQRTGRWAGRGLQPHNMHRSPEDQNQKVEALESGNRDWVALEYDNVMDVVASCIRAGVTAPEGKLLVVSDYGSIESRVLGWISGCKRINEIFAQGKDTYKDFAQELFRVPYEEVTKEQRTLAKPPVLGCGYQLGADGLVAYADGYGIKLSRKDAQRAVSLFRATYEEVPRMWKWLMEAAKDTLRYDRPNEGCCIRFRKDHQFLMLDLPSGRTLYYFRPLIQMKTVKIADAETGKEREWEVETVTYMGMDQFTHQWKRISTHGGKFTEQICQSIARDILAYGMVQIENNPLVELIGHVHDEPITMADSANAETALEQVNEILRTMPPWASGLLMGSEGYAERRYRK